MTSPYWPLSNFAGRNYAETARTEYKIWANHVAGAVPPTDDPNSGAIFTSDGSGGLIANNLYYIYPSNGAVRGGCLGLWAVLYTDMAKSLLETIY